MLDSQANLKLVRQAIGRCSLESQAWANAAVHTQKFLLQTTLSLTSKVFELNESGPTQIIQDNLPYLNSIDYVLESYLQNTVTATPRLVFE